VGKEDICLGYVDLRNSMRPRPISLTCHATTLSARVIVSDRPPTRALRQVRPLAHTHEVARVHDRDRAVAVLAQHVQLCSIALDHIEVGAEPFANSASETIFAIALSHAYLAAPPLKAIALHRRSQVSAKRRFGARAIF
jgi:hypothetical protein